MPTSPAQSKGNCKKVSGDHTKANRKNLKGRLTTTGYAPSARQTASLQTGFLLWTQELGLAHMTSQGHQEG